MTRACAGLLCAGLLGAAAPAERVVVTRAHLPVIVESTSGRSAACPLPRPGDLTVLLDGERIPVTAVGPRPLPRLHALVVDTSQSMRGRLAEAQAAARAYIDALPADERVLVAGFDDDLVLAAPATLDREAARRAVDGLACGSATALWDSLYHVLRYLETLDGERVVVLVSDGDDTVSPGRNPFARALELANRIPDLVVFAIGVGLPPGPEGGVRFKLHRLAEQSGGALLEIGAVRQIGPVLERVHLRLESRLYVSLAPPAETPAAGRRRSQRGLEIRSADPGCRVRVLGDRERFGSPPPTAPAAEPLLLDARGRLRGRALDVVRESPRRELASRAIEVDVPPLARVRAERRDAPEVLRALLLDEGLAAPPAGARPAFVVHGQTFLELRERLGRSLDAARGDYHAWAVERAAASAEREWQWLARDLPEGMRPGDPALGVLLESLRSRATDPGSGRVPAQLAEWLADVPLADAAVELERRLAEDLLVGAAAAEATAARAVSAWPGLAALFPAAGDARILVPLLPAYDPQRDAIGYYRFLVAPPPRRARESGWAERPWGLALVGSMVRDPWAERLLAGRRSVLSIRYGGAAAEARGQCVCGSRRAGGAPRHRVSVRLGPPPELGVFAVFDPTDVRAEPVCIAAFEAETGRCLGNRGQQPDSLPPTVLPERPDAS